VSDEPSENPGPSDTAVPRPRGRGRPPTIDQEELLAVARAVFLEKGFRATTQEVAERAGVSEGSLFHRFRTKEALFRSAMNLDLGQLQVIFQDALSAIESLPVEDALLELGRRLLEVGEVNIPLMMMTWSNPEACGEPADADKKAAYKQLFYRLIAYFNEQVRLGRIRAVDTEVLARAFMGALHHYCMVRVMNPDSESVMIPSGMYLRGLVDLVLRGALPKANPSP
jgi:AcrR family transcriptional regulator